VAYSACNLLPAISRAPGIPNQNNPGSFKRVKGIEPSYSAWKAAALPLSYTRETPQSLSNIDPLIKPGVFELKQTSL